MNYKRLETGIICDTVYGQQKVTFITEKIVRVNFIPLDSNDNQLSYMTQKLPAQKVELKMRESQEDLFLNTKYITVKVSKSNGAIEYYDNQLNRNLKQKHFHNTTVKGSSVSGKKKNHISVDFKTNVDTQYYGLGQHQNGLMSYKGSKIELKHLNSATVIPFLITNNGYGILWDNNGRTWMDVSEEESMVWESETGEIVDYYYIKGDSIEEIIEGYWQLTGPAVMIPKWAFGFWQSKMRYMTQGELLKIGEEYRKRQYPMDILVIDFYHWTEMGDFKFDRKFWPSPEKMFGKLADMNIKAMVSVWPDISKYSVNYSLMDEKGFLIKDHTDESVVFNFFNGDSVALYDPFNEEARKYIWEKVSCYHTQGARVWWLDSCEPDDGLLDFENYKDRGLYTSDGLLEERINAYPLMHAKAFYEGQRARDDNRVLILARSAFAGCQRYGVSVWSGDIGYDFEAFRKQIAAGLNATMSGLPFWTTDIGGFYGGDPKDMAYQELYVRWFQYGVFSPLFRVHGGRGATCQYDCDLGISRGHNELWSYGPELEEIMVKYDKLRYRLIPYIYSYARQTISTGSPLMRAMIVDFTYDRKVQNIADQYMFGKSIMVCPVTQEGSTSRAVYLPTETEWYDFWTGQKYVGGQTIIVETPLDKIPLFIKAGSIIPLGPVEQYVDEKSNPEITLRIYGGSDAELELYNDDGETYAYEKGYYSLIKVMWNEENQSVVLNKEIGGFPSESTRVFNIVKVDTQNGIGMGMEKQGYHAINYRGETIEKFLVSE